MLRPELCRTILFVKDIAKMADFYRDVLGLTTIDESQDGWRVFAAGSVELALHEIPEPWSRRVLITDPPTPRRTATTKLVFVVDDLQQAYDQLTTYGVRFDDNDFLNEPGQFVRCDLFDPEGNLIQLTTLAQSS